jgi:hypothetical protein
MKPLQILLAAALATFLFASVSGAAQVPVSLALKPDKSNPVSPMMGDHLRFWSTITNKGSSTIDGLVAWISLVEIDPGNEQPVDLEDWSAQKAVTGARLRPGAHLLTDWPVRLIKGGDYRVVVSVTDRGGRQVYTSPTIQFHVRQKPVLQAGRVVPVAAGIPLLFIGLLVFTTRKSSAAESENNRRW